MANAQKTSPHYPNPWIGRIVVIGLLGLVLALLAFTLLRPSSKSEMARSGAASVGQMDAAQNRADDQRAADRRTP